MIKLTYIGNFSSFDKNFEIISDETNNVINLYSKNLEYRDVECYQLDTDYVNSFKGNSLKEKTSNCWLYLFVQPALLEQKVFTQSFELEFWDDIIENIKKNGTLNPSKYNVEVTKVAR